MTDLNSQIEAAREKVTSLQQQVSQAQKANADQTLPRAAAAAGNTKLAQIRTGKVRRTLKGHFGKITAMHWSGDGRDLVSASQDGMLLVWNAQTTNKLQSISLKSAYVMSAGLEPGRGNLVASGGLDNLCTIHRRDNPGATPWELASHDGFLSCCRFLSEQQILTSSGDSTCILWDIQAQKPISTLAEHKADAIWLSLQPNAASPAAGAEGGGAGGASAATSVFASCSVDQTVKIWDVRTPQNAVMTFEGFFTSDVNCVEFMPTDAHCLAACSQDNSMRVLDMRAYNALARFSLDTNGAVAGNGGGEAGGGGSEGAGEGGAGGQDAPGGMPPEGFTSLTWSRSGRLVFCGHADGSLVAFDVLAGGSSSNSSGEAPPAYVQSAHEKHVSCVGMSPRGDALCTASWDGVLKIWA